MLSTLHGSGQDCLTPLPSSPVPIQPQELFQSWQLRGCRREGLLDYAGCGSLRDRSLSSPEPGWRRSYMGAWPCSRIMPVGKTKSLQSLRDCIFISGTSSARKPPRRFLQPWTSMSNHFLIPAIPEQGDNKILKLLCRQSILWQKQLPQQSPRSSR